jgi:hypothetical protein
MSEVSCRGYHSPEQHPSKPEDQLFIINRYSSGNTAVFTCMLESTAVTDMSTPIYLQVGIIVSDIILRQ